MNQTERRNFLISYLIDEQPRYHSVSRPANKDEQRMLLRSLMNVREPGFIDSDFLKVQDEYLQEIRREKGTVSIDDMTEIQPDLYIWQGDITRLKVGAIVNAANSGMTGCYRPGHNCIDNAIPF